MAKIKIFGSTVDDNTLGRRIQPDLHSIFSAFSKFLYRAGFNFAQIDGSGLGTVKPGLKRFASQNDITALENFFLKARTPVRTLSLFRNFTTGAGYFSGPEEVKFFSAIKNLVSKDPSSPEDLILYLRSSGISGLTNFSAYESLIKLLNNRTGVPGSLLSSNDRPTFTLPYYDFHNSTALGYYYPPGNKELETKIASNREFYDDAIGISTEQNSYRYLSGNIMNNQDIVSVLTHEIGHKFDFAMKKYPEYEKLRSELVRIIRDRFVNAYTSPGKSRIPIIPERVFDWATRPNEIIANKFDHFFSRTPIDELFGDTPGENTDSLMGDMLNLSRLKGVTSLRDFAFLRNLSDRANRAILDELFHSRQGSILGERLSNPYFKKNPQATFYDYLSKTLKLAGGGLISRPTFALMGENGEEYVINNTLFNAIKRANKGRFPSDADILRVFSTHPELREEALNWAPGQFSEQSRAIVPYVSPRIPSMLGNPSAYGKEDILSNPRAPTTIFAGAATRTENVSNEVYKKALELLGSIDSVSISLLRSRLKVNFEKARETLEQLEKAGYVAPAKSGDTLLSGREVLKRPLVTPQQPVQAKASQGVTQGKRDFDEADLNKMSLVELTGALRIASPATQPLVMARIKQKTEQALNSAAVPPTTGSIADRLRTILSLPGTTTEAGAPSLENIFSGGITLGKKKGRATGSLSMPVIDTPEKLAALKSLYPDIMERFSSMASGQLLVGTGNTIRFGGPITSTKQPGVVTFRLRIEVPGTGKKADFDLTKDEQGTILTSTERKERDAEEKARIRRERTAASATERRVEREVERELKRAEEAELARLENLRRATETYERYPRVAERLARQDPNFLTSETRQVYEIKKNNVTRLRASYIDPLGIEQVQNVSVDRHGRVLMDLNSRMAEFSQSLRRNMGQFTQWSLAVALIYTPMQKLISIVQDSITNQEMLAKATITLGQSQVITSKIFSDAAKISRETGSSITGIIEGYNLAYRATGSVTDATERFTKANILMRDSVVLSRVSTLSQAEATDVLVAALNQTNTPIEKGANLIDKWVRISRIANVDVATLATTFAIVGEAASNAGLSIEELNGLIAIIAEAGVTSARETGNVVRALVSGYTTDPAIKELEKYGIAVKNAEGQTRGFKDVFQDIRAAQESGFVTPDQVNKIAYAIGGGNRRQAQAVTAIVNMGRMNELAGQQYNAEGESQRALNIAMNTLANKMLVLGNSFLELAQSLGTKGGILDAASSFVTVLDMLVRKVTAVSDAFGTLLPALLISTAASKLGITGGLKDLASGTLMTGYQTLRTAQFMGSQALGAKVPNWMARDYGKQVKQDSEAFAANVMSSPGARWASGMLAPAIMAFSESQKSSIENAGFVFAGGVLGGIVSGGNPVAMMIGSAIAEYIVNAFEEGKRKTEATPAGGTPSEKRPTPGDRSIEQIESWSPEAKLTYKAVFGKNYAGGPLQMSEAGVEQLYKDLLSGLQYQKTVKLNLPSDVGMQEYLEALSTAPKGEKPIIRRGDKSYTAEKNVFVTDILDTLPVYRALAKKGGVPYEPFTKEELEKSLAEYGASKGFTTDQYNAFNVTKDFIGAQVSGIVDRYMSKTEEDLRQRLAPGSLEKITSKQYVEGMKNVKGWKGSISTLLAGQYLGYTGTGEQLEPDISRLATILGKGSPEIISELKQQAQGIGDLYKNIELARKEGPGVRVTYTDETGQLRTGKEGLTQAEAGARLRKQQEIYTQSLMLAERDIKLATPVREFTAYRELSTAEYREKVIPTAKKLRDAERAKMTQTEREAEEARDAQLDYFVKLKEGIERETSISSRYAQEAIEKLRKDKEIMLEETFAGFGAENATYTQIQNALSQYPAFLKRVQQASIMPGTTEPLYKEDKSMEVVIAKGGEMLFINKDMKILQYLLQKILETEEKQLTGIYNLPTDAGFYVPLNALELRPNLEMLYGNRAEGEVVNERGEKSIAPLEEYVASSLINEGRGETEGALDYNDIIRRYKGYETPSATELLLEQGRQDRIEWEKLNENPYGKLNESLAVTIPPMSLTMNLVNETRLTIDGKQIAQAISTYLASDMVRFDNAVGSVSFNVIS